MSNGTVTSQPPTPVTDSPPDVLPPVQEAIKQAGIKPGEVSDVILGSAKQSPPKTPKVQNP